jgi:hypothetical protein
MEPVISRMTDYAAQWSKNYFMPQWSRRVSAGQ